MDNIKLTSNPDRRSPQGVVVLGYGPQPMDWLSKAAKLCGKTAIVDPDVARMAGANLAAGDPDALQALRKLLEAGAMEAAQAANPGMTPAAVKWLAHGERGVSSNTIFTYLTGVDACNGDMGHPHDPSDFRRCRLLLEQVPELQPLLPGMKTASRAWSSLVAKWDDICNSMDTEMPYWRDARGGTAPQTYALIRAAVGR
jgi:hypothetical protein